MPTPNDIPPRKPVRPTEPAFKFVREEKKPSFVRKPHLTDRAFKNHPDLLDLKKGLRR